MTMKTYLGVQFTEAEPMNLGDYLEFKGRMLPDEEDPLTRGYMIKHSNERFTWTPKGFFDRFCKLEGDLNLGLAVEAVKQGERVARHCWTEKGTWITLQKGYPAGIECNKNSAEAYNIKLGTVIKVLPYFVMKNADDSFSPWIPNQSDLMADDYYIITK